MVNVIQMTDIIATVRESNLKLTLAFGIGMHHTGLHQRDRKTMEELFVNCKIQVGPRQVPVDPCRTLIGPSRPR